MKRRICGAFVAVPLIDEGGAEREAAAEQLASAKGETPRYQTRKAPAVQVLFVVEVRGVEPRSNRPLTVLSTCLACV